jgi:hypothetical protein
MQINRAQLYVTLKLEVRDREGRGPKERKGGKKYVVGES